MAEAPPTRALPPIPPPQSTSSPPTTKDPRHPIPSFSIHEHADALPAGRNSSQSGSSFTPSSDGHSRTPSRETPDLAYHRDSAASIAVTRQIPIHQLHINDSAYHTRYSHAAEMHTAHVHDDHADHDDHDDEADAADYAEYADPVDPTRHHQHQVVRPAEYNQPPTPPAPTYSPRQDVQSPNGEPPQASADSAHHRYSDAQDTPLQVPRTTLPRPSSAYTLGSDLAARGRTLSPLSIGASPPPPQPSPNSFARPLSTNRWSPDARPSSTYVDLVNLPYNQQVAPAANFGNATLRGAVGQNASLLDAKKTLDMYRANLKKTQDSVVQYEFALFMVQVARDVMASGSPPEEHGLAPSDLLREARQILQRLADRSYPFAQYYLADGYASGLFNKDKPDYDRAFPLFVAASKHGHAESGYRTALCYEFGWGCRKDYAKAVQFFRAAASKNHPGAATRLGKACLTGDMGLQGKYREGVKWLKRASESADFQYNNAPYELGLLHETGYGDDIFKDEVYAVQLFTQAAELGHPAAALKLGEAYEHGLLCCPKDAALSVHYYNCAAQADIPEAMMNLCAWYMVGAEPVLEKDENEAYEWAKKAAEHGLPKAEYACGYFTEMGIGCRRDTLEANVWYVKACDHGDERAKQRLAIIHAAASGQDPTSPSIDKGKLKKGSKDKDKDENCVLM